jgi:hypothetical protein
MSQQLKNFDSLGGFSVQNTELITSTKDITNANTLQVKNSNYSDASSTHYILRGNSGSVLSLDSSGTQITIPSDTLSFVTAHVLASNATGGGYLSLKIESTVKVETNGNVTEISNLRTVIKDSVPSVETWTITPFDSGANNRFSYFVRKEGGTAGESIKWLAYVQVVSIDWT